MVRITLLIWRKYWAPAGGRTSKPGRAPGAALSSTRENGVCRRRHTDQHIRWTGLLWRRIQDTGDSYQPDPKHVYRLFQEPESNLEISRYRSSNNSPPPGYNTTRERG